MLFIWTEQLQLLNWIEGERRRFEAKVL